MDKQKQDVYGRTVVCNHCGKQFDMARDGIHIQTIETVNRMYFTCPHCGAEYTILYTTPESRVMIKRRTVIAAAIKSQKGKKPASFFKKLLKEDEELQKAIKEISDALKEVDNGTKGIDGAHI